MMQAMRMIMRSSNICESFVPNSVYTQCIRWKRKPIWLPPGKSKMFRIPKRPVIPIEESRELQRLFNVYRTCISSLRLHIKTVVADNKVELDEEEFKQIEEKDFQKCKIINDEWNANVAKIREARLVEERKVSKEKAFEQIMKIEEKQEELKQKVDEEIKKIKEEAATFITAENIDEAIEECLANVVSHNRALNLDGSWYPATPPTEEVATQSTVVQQ